MVEPAAAPAAAPAPPPPIAPPRSVAPRAGETTITLDFQSMERRGLITPGGPRTRLGEEFRLIKRPLLQYALKSGVRAAKLVMITSPYPNEGKSFTSVNLAMSLSVERDLNVLLIDIDPYKSGAMNLLGLAPRRGLIDVLNGDATIDDVLMRCSNLPNFTVISSGAANTRTTELLASGGMARLMTEIDQRYPDRIVVIDAPPVLEISETSAIALNVGQIIMVVAVDRSGPNATAAALGLVQACPQRFIIMNRVSQRQAAHGFGASDSYGYGYG